MHADQRPNNDVGALLAGIFTDDRVLDLTLPLAEELPCTWPGHMPFRATVWSWFAARPADPQPVHPGTGGSYQTRWLVVDEHTGTHADAPRHFIPPLGSGLPNAGPGGDIGIDRLPLLAAAGPADVVDVTSLRPASPGHSPAVGPEQLAGWEAAHGAVQPGDVVLLRSGWDEWYRRGPRGARYGSEVLAGTQPGWPAPTPEAMKWLHERGVRCVGTDGLSVGPAEDGAPTHLAGLGRGITFVEALTGLAGLPPRGAWFMFLPIRLVDGTGGPGRALAVLPGPDPNPREHRHLAATRPPEGGITMSDKETPRPDVMGGPEPDEERTDVLSGKDPDEQDTDVMRGRQPDEEDADTLT